MGCSMRCIRTPRRQTANDGVDALPESMPKRRRRLPAGTQPQFDSGGLVLCKREQPVRTIHTARAESPVQVLDCVIATDARF